MATVESLKPPFDHNPEREPTPVQEEPPVEKRQHRNGRKKKSWE